MHSVERAGCGGRDRGGLVEQERFAEQRTVRRFAIDRRAPYTYRTPLPYGHRHPRPTPTLTPESMVIPKVHRRGTSVSWLLRYLFNPRPGGEHHNPHIAAAWAYATTGNLADLDPPRKANGRYDLQTLTFNLEVVVRAARILYHTPAKLVWHCSIHNHPDDPVLSDQQWEHIATEIMHAVGLAPHGDIDAVRWIGIRHAANHVHIVATMIRQDGRTAYAWRDYRNVQTACRELEKHFGLHQVAPAATSRRPRPAELHKANRNDHDQVPRDQLREQIRTAAAAAAGVRDFANRLQAAGLRVRLRTNGTSPEQATGYAVALPGHHTAAGEAIWYGGGQLDTDLTLPKLRNRWSAAQPILDAGSEQPASPSPPALALADSRPSPGRSGANGPGIR